MIRSAPYYWVTCDKCGERADYYEYGAWSEPADAVDMAEGGDWITEGEKHFCPGCQVVCADCEIRCAAPDADSRCDRCREVGK